MVLNMKPLLDKSVLGHHATSRTTHRVVTQSNMCPPCTSTGHNIGGRENCDDCSLVSLDCFNQALEHEVITFFLFCLASIDATLTAIVCDRLLLCWYSTIAAGGVCVPIIVGHLHRSHCFRLLHSNTHLLWSCIGRHYFNCDRDYGQSRNTIDQSMSHHWLFVKVQSLQFIDNMVQRSKTKIIPLQTPDIDPNWISIELTIALVKFFK